MPQLATVDLSGATVTGTFSRGKHLLTHIEHDDAWTLHTHLKMEGSWHVYPLHEKWRRPATQVRVVLRIDDPGRGRVLPGRRRAGAAVRTSTSLVAHLGPDLLGGDWDEAEALRRLRSDPARPVGDALLDQTNLAGIGNMYMAELCFTSGVHPARRPVGEVPGLVRLVRRARQMLDVNKERAIQSTTGDLRPARADVGLPARQLAVPPVRHAGRASAMRGAPGRERAAYWCPRCQPAAPGTGQSGGRGDHVAGRPDGPR